LCWCNLEGFEVSIFIELSLEGRKDSSVMFAMGDLLQLNSSYGVEQQ
jgi:hypothetical protein